MKNIIIALIALFSFSVNAQVQFDVLNSMEVYSSTKIYVDFNYTVSVATFQDEGCIVIVRPVSLRHQELLVGLEIWSPNKKKMYTIYNTSDYENVVTFLYTSDKGEEFAIMSNLLSKKQLTIVTGDNIEVKALLQYEGKIKKVPISDSKYITALCKAAFLFRKNLEIYEKEEAKTEKTFRS